MGKVEIIIWCHLSTDIEGDSKQSKRRKREPSKRAEHARSNEQAADDVQAIVMQLKSRHGSTYSTEHINAWARLINIKKASIS